MSESRVEGYRNFATKMWNAARFCQVNECRLDPAFDPADCRQTVNRWAVGRVATLVARLDQALAEYKFNEAAHAIYHGIWGEFCDWYLEFAKPIFAGSDDAAKAETRAAVAWALGRLLHLLHPFMPFITEELWQQVLGQNDPLIVAPWPALPASLIDEAASAEIDWVIRVVSDIRALRAEMNVQPGAELAAHFRDAGAKLDRYRGLIERLARIRIAAGGEAPAGAVQLIVGDATILLSLAGHLDIDRERARIQKDIDRSAGEAGKAEKKLANRDFVAKAPAEVVEELRERLAEEQARREKLGVALQRLNALTGK
jgi:valyl-tRNA synthetase